MVRCIPNLNLKGALPIGKRNPISGDDAGKHDSVRAADPFSFDVAHRRLAWMFRASVMTNIILLIVISLLASAFSAIVPLKTVEVALLRTDDADNRIYRVEPISKNMDGFDLFMQQKARRFVYLLLSIDFSQRDRMTEAVGLADRTFFAQWMKENEKKITKAIDDGINRSIIIETSNLVDVRGQERLYAVDYIQTDLRDGVAVEEPKKLRAFLIMDARPQEVPEKDKFENPLGVRVLKMSLQHRQPSPKPTSPETKPEVPAP